jgi:hypothetical protein
MDGKRKLIQVFSKILRDVEYKDGQKTDGGTVYKGILRIAKLKLK